MNVSEKNQNEFVYDWLDIVIVYVYTLAIIYLLSLIKLKLK